MASDCFDVWRRRLWCLAWPLSFAIFTLILLRACSWLGYLVGWLIGASVSPIAATALPLVFGLLAAVGIGVGARNMTLRLSSLWAGIVVTLGVVWFCTSLHTGLAIGGRDRVAPYPSMQDLTGDVWETLDSDLATEVYRLRWAIRESRQHRLEFKAFMTDVVVPILTDSKLTNKEKKDAIVKVREAIIPIEKPTPKATS